MYLDIFIVYRILGWQYFFQYFRDNASKSSSLHYFYEESSILSSLFFCAFFLWQLLRFYYLPPLLNNLIITECNVFFSVFFRVHWTSWIDGSVIFIQFGKALAIVQIFLLSPFLHPGDFSHMRNHLLEIVLQFTDTSVFLFVHLFLSYVFHFDSFYCVFK